MIQKMCRQSLLCMSYQLLLVSAYRSSSLHLFSQRHRSFPVNGFSERTDSIRYENPVSVNKIAVLIDGDNAESSLIAEFLAESGRFGRVTVKRIYADWTSSQMKSWKDKLNSHAVRPIQKFAYTVTSMIP